MCTQIVNGLSMIILIPGLGGSKIYCCCEKYNPIKLYPKKIVFRSLNKHFFQCTNVKTKILKSFFGISIYKKILNDLNKNGIAVKCFSYDWRQTPLFNALQLRNYLTEETNGEDLLLVGHSMGGILIRILIEHLKFNKNIKKTLICGTPLYGSMSYVDYNMEYGLYVSVNSNSTSLLDTPFLFTENDKDNYFFNFMESIKYLMPTFTIHGNCKKINFNSNIVNVHKDFSKFNFKDVEYNFYFNVSKNQKRKFTNVCNFKRQNPEQKLIHVKHIKDDIIYLNEPILTDGLIMAPRNIKNIHAIFYVDKSFSFHSLLMNNSNIMFIINKMLK